MNSSIFTVKKVPVVFVALFFMLGIARAATEESRMVRIGGDYILGTITAKCREQIQPVCFRIVFDAVTKTGRFDQLVLESNHINVGINKGDRVRLSAEIAVDRGQSAEVSQVVLFEGAPGSRPPVWILSSKHRAGPGPSARYLEMHSPQTDFLVL